MRHILTQSLSKRSGLILALSLVAALLLGVGGRAIYRKLAHLPPTPAQVRAVLWDYLKEHSGQKEFAINLPALTNAEPATLITTNAAGRVRMKLRKRDAASSGLDLTRGFRAQLAQANDYKAIYRLIGGQLAAAEKLLLSTNPPQRAAGVLAVLAANRAAQGDASDAWLGARICEAYLWPYIDSVGTSQSGKPSAENLLDTAEQTFRQADEPDNLIRNYRLLIRTTPRPDRADAARFRLARLLQQQEDLKGALQCLCEIQTTNNPSLERRVAALEQRLQARK